MGVFNDMNAFVAQHCDHGPLTVSNPEGSDICYAFELTCPCGSTFAVLKIPTGKAGGSEATGAAGIADD